MLHPRGIRTALTAALLVAGAALIAGCGGSSNGGSSQQAASSHKVVSFIRAADLSANAAGYKLNMVMSETIGDQTINLSADGSYTPKSHQGSMTVNMALPTALGGQQQFQMVMSDGVFYMKFPPTLASEIPGGMPWVSINLDQLAKAAHLPGLGSLLNSSSSINDPGEYLDFLRAAADGSVTDVGQELVDGVETTHYEAELQFSKLAEALPASDRQGAQQLISELQSKISVGDIPVDVWIDGADLVRRMMMNMNETVAGQTVDQQITENFSDYGTQPAPTIPSADQTTNLLSLINAGG